MIFFCSRLSHFSWINVNKYEKWYFISALCADGTNAEGKNDERRARWRRRTMKPTKRAWKRKKNIRKIWKAWKSCLFSDERIGSVRRRCALAEDYFLCEAWCLMFVFFSSSILRKLESVPLLKPKGGVFSAILQFFALFSFFWFCYVRIAYNKASGLGRNGHSWIYVYCDDRFDESDVQP